MFAVNTEDNSIYVTRGDILFFSVQANDNGQTYIFQPGDIVRINVTEKKACENVVLQKDFLVSSATDTVEILLTEKDTKIGETISKARDYWYEIVLNPETNPQTIIGYDEDGAKIFKLFPEGDGYSESEDEEELTPEDIPIIDDEIDVFSDRPVRNRAIAREIVRIDNDIDNLSKETTASISALSGRITAQSNEIAVERARITNLATLASGSTTGDAELIDGRVGADGVNYDSIGEAIRGQLRNIAKVFAVYSPDVQRGVYIGASGEYAIGSSWYTTLPIFLRAGEVITVHGKCPYYAFYDLNDKYIEGTYKVAFDVASATPPNTYDVTAPQDCLIRLSAWNLDQTEALYQEPSEVYIERKARIPQNVGYNSIGYEHIKHGALNKRHFGASLVAKCSELKLCRNYILSADDGSYKEDISNDYYSTDFIPVEPNTNYWINYEYPHTAYFYDKDKQPIKWVGASDFRVSSFSHPVPTGNITRKHLFTSPPNACYIRFNVNVKHIADQCMGYGDLILTDSEIATASSNVHVDYLMPKEMQTKSEWDGKTFISLGTSISWQDGNEYASTGLVARGYQTVIKEKLGFASYKNDGKSGRSMANGTANGDGTNTTGKENDYTLYDLVIIEVGTNDFKLNAPIGTIGSVKDTSFNTNTFYGAYRDLLKYILTSNPTIKIVLLTPIQRNNAGYDTEYTNSAGHKLEDYVNAIKAIGKMYALPVCDLYSNSGINALTLSTYTMDGLHPNDVGYERMGEYCSAFLKNI